MRDDTLPPGERALAGRSLAALGDPRPEVTTLEGMQFCLVPQGSFVMGDDSEEPAERPQHKVELDYPYFIGRFPVTVAQWYEYIKSSDASSMEAELSQQGRPNEPVLWVSWHAALHFCRFLSQQWRDYLPKGWRVTLPSEAEWEKAARGGEFVPTKAEFLSIANLSEALDSAAGFAQTANPHPARRYPWSDSHDPDCANMEGAIGEASAVGCYPKGASPFGCEEMSGNVWEWTRSLW
jgi:formylglycine-generating enzyme required for sulfatase activity